MTKILIVDDEEHIRFLYSEELTEAGYEVITADSGNKLLERIDDEQPDLVVLDIKMVDYNGLDLLQDIRNQFADLPVILCTAYDTFKEDMKSIAADFYVIKSFDLTELKTKIKTALQRKEAVAENGDSSSLI
jgi:two-component system, response regulator, stage 0 sporulation protein F